MTTTLRPTSSSALAALAVLAVALFALLAAQPASAAPSPGATALREASALAERWGRCPTSRPAHRALAAARTAPPRARAARARVALRSWRAVVRECSAPVQMPIAVPTA